MSNTIQTSLLVSKKLVLNSKFVNDIQDDPALPTDSPLKLVTESAVVGYVGAHAFNGIVIDPNSPLPLYGNGTESNPLGANTSGGGITEVVTDPSSPVHLYGNGTSGNPLGVDLPEIATLYTSDGSIGGTRTVSVSNGGELDITANEEFPSNTANFKIRGGGGNSGVMLMANGQSEGFSAGQYGFKIYNGGNANTDVNITNGSVQLVDLGSFEIRRGTLSTSFSRLISNPSGFQGLKLMDVTMSGGVGNTQSISQISSLDSTSIQSQGATFTASIDMKSTSIVFNRTLNAGIVVTPLLSIDITNSKVVLPQLLNTSGTQFLTTDASGNIGLVNTPTLDQVLTSGASSTKAVSIGNTTINGTIKSIGSVTFPIKTRSDGETIDDTDFTVIGNTSAANCTLTMPAIGSNGGRIYMVYRSANGNTLTLNAGSGQTFVSSAGSSSTSTITVTNAVILVAFGTQWIVISQN